MFLHVHTAAQVSCYLAEKTLVTASQVEQQKAQTVAPYVQSNERHSTSIAVDSIRILDVERRNTRREKHVIVNAITELQSQSVNKCTMSSPMLLLHAHAAFRNNDHELWACGV